MAFPIEMKDTFSAIILESHKLWIHEYWTSNKQGSTVNIHQLKYELVFLFLQWDYAFFMNKNLLISGYISHIYMQMVVCITIKSWLNSSARTVFLS